MCREQNVSNNVGSKLIDQAGSCYIVTKDISDAAVFVMAAAPADVIVGLEDDVYYNETYEKPVPQTDDNDAEGKPVKQSNACDERPDNDYSEIGSQLKDSKIDQANPETYETQGKATQQTDANDDRLSNFYSEIGSHLRDGEIGAASPTTQVNADPPLKQTSPASNGSANGHYAVLYRNGVEQPYTRLVDVRASPEHIHDDSHSGPQPKKRGVQKKWLVIIGFVVLLVLVLVMAAAIGVVLSGNDDKDDKVRGGDDEAQIGSFVLHRNISLSLIFCI